MHPIVRKKMNLFLNKNKNKRFIVLDIPLFFENKMNHRNNNRLLQIQFKLDTINCPIPFGTLASDLGKGKYYKRFK